MLLAVVGQDWVNGLWMEAGLPCWSQRSRTEKWRLDEQSEGGMETHTKEEQGTRAQLSQGFPGVQWPEGTRVTGTWNQPQLSDLGLVDKCLHLSACLFRQARALLS